MVRREEAMSLTMMPAAAGTRNTVAGILADLESIWAGFDQIFSGLGPDAWSKRHGKDWTYAVLPYHLAYFDRELTIPYLGWGVEVAPDDRWLMDNEAKVDAWNARMLAKRPADQSVERSLVELSAVHGELRLAIGGLSDADLRRPAWSPFFGWIT